MIDLRTLQATWNYPTTVLFGAGAVRKLPRACKEAGFRRPLVVTDAGLASSTIVAGILERLREAGLAPGLFAR